MIIKATKETVILHTLQKARIDGIFNVDEYVTAKFMNRLIQGFEEMYSYTKTLEDRIKELENK